eukprot:GILK01012221.1.p2 GENE.GILK01012221.1~~GILK01012221.1.p2  ORF type:complete len:391 (+),score=37.73 GILK01012221.1:1716-2888(+)
MSFGVGLLHFGMHMLSCLYSIGFESGLNKIAILMKTSSAVTRNFKMKDYDENHTFFTRCFWAIASLIMKDFLKESHAMLGDYEFKNPRVIPRRLDSRFKTWRNEKQKLNPVFKFWSQFIFDYSWVYFELLASTRLGDARLLRLASIFYTPLFHGTGKTNYTKECLRQQLEYLLRSPYKNYLMDMNTTVNVKHGKQSLGKRVAVDWIIEHINSLIPTKPFRLESATIITQSWFYFAQLQRFWKEMFANGQSAAKRVTERRRSRKRERRPASMQSFEYSNSKARAVPYVQNRKPESTDSAKLQVGRECVYNDVLLIQHLFTSARAFDTAHGRNENVFIADTRHRTGHDSKLDFRQKALESEDLRKKVELLCQRVYVAPNAQISRVLSTQLAV